MRERVAGSASKLEPAAKAEQVEPVAPKLEDPKLEATKPEESAEPLRDCGALAQPVGSGEAPPGSAAPVGTDGAVAAPVSLSSGIVAAVTGVHTGAGAAAVRQCAQEWANLCQRDLRTAVREVLAATLALSGLPGSLQACSSMDGDPKVFLERLPEWVRTEGLDLQVYPLLPSMKNGRRSVMNFERFWTFSINCQNASALLDGRIVATLTSWLLAMSNAIIRSLRHVSTIAALAIAEALGHHHQALNRMHDTVKRQMESGGANNPRQQAQVQRNLQKASAQVGEMYRARSQLLEATVPIRSRDVSEIIRLHTLCEVEKLMKQDPEMYLSNKWTARVFLMIHDPAVEVRLKAIQVIQSWYSGIQKSEAVREHLSHFAQRGLSHLVERIGDVDARVATAALRCLRSPTLAESLEDEEFDKIVNLCIGAEDDSVREEAALFINSHVFQDPGICGPVSDKRRRGGRASAKSAEEPDAPEGEGGDDDGDGGPDTVKELYNSETSISMLVEYLENYVGENLRISDRVVGAFWARAPALSHWGTMVNLCLVGESQRGASMDPVSPRQRLALLYIMEAAVRRAEEEFRSARPEHREPAAVKLNDACTKIIPELPRLLEICRPDEQHSLLFSHVCKILLEYAVDNAQNQVIVNTKALCEGLRRAIEGQTPLDTVKYCVDALLALARCFDEAKAAFLDLAKAAHSRCAELLRPEGLGAGAEELRAVLGRLVVLSNRGIDMTFGSIHMLNSIVGLLRSRSEWQKGRSQADLDAGREVAAAESGKDAQSAEGNGGAQAAAEPDAVGADDPRGARGADEAAGVAAASAGHGDQGAPLADKAAAAAPNAVEEEADRPAEVPDRRMSLQLIEAAAVAVMWHARMAFWVETYSGQGAGGSSAEAQVSEMLQGFGELPALRAELPKAVSRLRLACAELISHDTSAHVQFHAFSAYMSLLQLAVGVSEKISLELGPEGGSGPTARGGSFDVTVPMEHNQALWQYLNSFYIRLSGTDAEGIKFDADGFNVMPVDVYPAPSQGSMTSARFLTLRCLQPATSSTSIQPDRHEELMLAVLASRMVLESEVEDVHAGPLGLLLLTQCERGRPKPLRDVAMSAFRRLREIARVSEDLAVQFFRVQQDAVASLFECAGAEAAQALSYAFVRQWGPRLMPWFEMPHFTVLRDAVMSCITEDKHRLPLLEVFGGWVRHDFNREGRFRELTSELLARCQEAGFDGEADMFVRRFLQRLGTLQHQPAAPVAPPAHAGAAAVGAAVAPNGVVAASSAAAEALNVTAARAGFPVAPAPLITVSEDPVEVVSSPERESDRRSPEPQAPPASTVLPEAEKPWTIPTKRISGKRAAEQESEAAPPAETAPRKRPAPGRAIPASNSERKRGRTQL